MWDHISLSAAGSISESVVHESVLGDGIERSGAWVVGEMLRGEIRSSRPRDGPHSVSDGGVDW